MTRLLLQMLTLLALSVVAAFSMNALRSDGLRWGGSDPDEIRFQGVQFISIEEAAVLKDDVQTLILDARAPQEFERRRAFGALSFPADEIEAAYGELRDFLDPGMTIIVYAQETLLSVQVVEFLEQRGFNARVLRGGWDAWQAQRLPVEGGAS